MSSYRSPKLKNKQRNLTQNEIDDILSFIIPNPWIPEEIAINLVQKRKEELQHQLKNNLIYPNKIPDLKKELEAIYKSSLIQPGEAVGVITAQCLGERTTQGSLSRFHKAGSVNTSNVSSFSELLNATNKPKVPGYFIYLKGNNKTVSEVRESINHTILQITFKKITKKAEIKVDKDRYEDPWYQAFLLMNPEETTYTDCISLDINMDILYEYKLSLKNIADYIAKEYVDLYCVYSPDCYARMDIYADTSNIDLPEEKLVFVTPENCREIYLDEVVQPTLESMVITGIPGIINMYYLEKNGEWIIETENAREKVLEKTKFKNTKTKPADSTKRFKQMLANPKVDFTRSVSNNIWDIYHTLGVDAVRQYMIDQFSEIMEGINLCHIMLLVDFMTFRGSIHSISRYSMKNASVAPLHQISFEEALTSILNSAFYCDTDNLKSVSSSIIVGKKPTIGSGLNELVMDLEKLTSIREPRESREESDTEE